MESGDSINEQKVKRALSVWLLPAVVTIVGMLLMQRLTVLEDRLNEINLGTIKNQEMIIELMSRMNDKDDEIELIRQELQELRDHDRANDLWIRDWLERYQGAVNWAKKNNPNE
jgi:hypothetical protein